VVKQECDSPRLLGFGSWATHAVETGRRCVRRFHKIPAELTGAGPRPLKAGGRLQFASSEGDRHGAVLNDDLRNADHRIHPGIGKHRRQGAVGGGGNDAAAEGAWVWSSGQTPGYSNWNEGEPNNSTEPEYGEDYAVLNWNYDTGAWNDWDHMRGDYQHIQGIAEIPGGDGVPDGGATAGLLGLGFLALAGLKRARKV